MCVWWFLDGGVWIDKRLKKFRFDSEVIIVCPKDSQNSVIRTQTITHERTHCFRVLVTFSTGSNKSVF